MLDTTFHYYPAQIKKPKPLGTVTLEQFIEAHKNPKDNIRKTFEEIAACEARGDLARKGELKTNNLFYFTPSIFTDGQGRAYCNITGFTGILVFEFDHINNAEAFKQFLFNAIPSIICAYLGPSKKSVKFLLKIPKVNTIEEYKQYFYGIAFYMEKYNGFDGSNQNPALPLFISWDENLLYREDAETWTQKGVKLGEFDYNSEAGEADFLLEEVTDQHLQSVKNVIKGAIDKIVDNGWPQLRSSVLAAGGFCGAGYISEEDMEEWLIECVGKNDYLQKDIKGYTRNIKKFLKEGIKKPMLLKD